MPSQHRGPGAVAGHEGNDLPMYTGPDLEPPPGFYMGADRDSDVKQSEGLGGLPGGEASELVSGEEGLLAAAAALELGAAGSESAEEGSDAPLERDRSPGADDDFEGDEAAES